VRCEAVRRSPGDGQRFEIDQAIFMHVRDGKADEIWAIVDSEFLQMRLFPGSPPGRPLGLLRAGIYRWRAGFGL
jgi:hypothetical protein